jgi:hypothetical protein
MTTTRETWQEYMAKVVAQREAEDAEMVAPYKARIALLLEALRKREWMGKGYDYTRHCPLCRGFEDEGHKADCAVGLAIAEAEATEGR